MAKVLIEIQKKGSLTWPGLRPSLDIDQKYHFLAGWFLAIKIGFFIQRERSTYKRAPRMEATDFVKTNIGNDVISIVFY